MAKPEEGVFEILNNVELFLRQTLEQSRLTPSEIEGRDILLQKIAYFRRSFSQFSIPTTTTPTTVMSGGGGGGGNSTVPSSPPPYLDMKGNNFSADYVFSDPTEGHYEICEQDSNLTNEETVPVNELKANSELDDSMYDALKNANATAVPASELTNSLKKGFLDKKGRGLFNQYHRRWCAIKDGVLYYYTHITDNRQCGSIALYGYEVRSLVGSAGKDKKNFGFELVCPGKRTYQFVAYSQIDMLEWIAAIEKSSDLRIDVTDFKRHSAEVGNSVNDGKSRRISSVDDGLYEAVEEDIWKKQIAEKLAKELYDDAKSCDFANVGDWYLGMWDCNADDANELSFKNGQLIRVISKEHDRLSWWIGETNGKVGLVPKNFLTEAYDVTVEE